SKLLHEIALMHTFDAANEVHRRTSFHPWHRVFQIHLERELQEIDPRVAIPYWKFDKMADRVFTAKFVGETKQSDDFDQDVAEIKRPTFDLMNPLLTYVEHTVWGPLRRAYKEINPAVGKPDRIYTESMIIDGPDSSEYFLYWSRFEERRSHNQAHNAFTGHVVDVGRDPVDPLFFMMHGNVDRLWALWQEKHNRYDGNQVNTYPFQNKYAGERGAKWALLETADEDGIYIANNDDIGNFAEDTLWPWDWDIALSRPMRKWSSMDPDYGTGSVPQINIDFPESAASNYPDGPITVKSTIDYQGRLSNMPALGFDYDCIPYFDRDKKPYDQINVSSTKRQNQPHQNNKDEQTEALYNLSDKTADLHSRIKSIELIDETSEIFLDTAINIIADPSEPYNLRSELILDVFAAKRSNRHFPSRKPRFFDILRGLLTDENRKLRFQAIDILAASEDEIVQDFLISELKKEQSEFISKTDAIFFLRQNTKPQHAALFRKLFEESNDPEVRKAAIQGLGNDPDAIELLKKVVQDIDENFKIREAGALSLHHLDHETMNAVAEKIVAEPESGDDIMLFRSSSPDPDEVDFKTGLLNMLTFTGDVNRLKENEGLKSTLKQVVDPSTGNKANFRSSFELLAAAPSVGPTIIEQMAAKLLNRLEGNDNE
ncbi:tyrosinase family protein, partial [Persicitalea sp.]|uniref:tyrosinase family protein n=1 Tax=Persicitalea sp. TaxID=3100273 RepID=UPI00359399A3